MDNEAMGKIKLRLASEESRKRWELIKEASEEVNKWDELKRAEAYRRSSVNEQNSERSHPYDHVL